jgi:hypothetical protein
MRINHLSARQCCSHRRIARAGPRPVERRAVSARLAESGKAAVALQDRWPICPLGEQLRSWVEVRASIFALLLQVA